MPYAKRVDRFPDYMKEAVERVANDEREEATFAFDDDGKARSMMTRFYALFRAANKEWDEVKETAKIGTPAWELRSFYLDCNQVVPRVVQGNLVLKNKNADFAATVPISYKVGEKGERINAILPQNPMAQRPPPTPVSERAQSYGAKNIGMTKEQADALVAKAKGVLKE